MRPAADPPPVAAPKQPLSVTVCHRPLPVERGSRHGVTRWLDAAGHRVTETGDARLTLDPDAVLWIQDNPMWFPKVCRSLAATPRDRRPFVVLWFSEPLPPPRAAGLPRPRLHLREVAKIVLRDARATDVYSNARRLRALVRDGLVDLLVASTPGRCEYLADHGITATFVPLGYEVPDHAVDLERTRDIDVLFLGELVPRRKRLLDRLEADGIRVERCGSWFDPAFWGENRTRLLERTRIFLNLARHPGELPGKRLILGMSHGALVVSEPIHAPGPYEPGRHLVTCPLAEMPDVIRNYLEQPDECDRIARAGYRLVTETVTMERSVARIVERVEHMRADGRTG